MPITPQQNANMQAGLHGQPLPYTDSALSALTQDLLPIAGVFGGVLGAGADAAAGGTAATAGAADATEVNAATGAAAAGGTAGAGAGVGGGLATGIGKGVGQEAGKAALGAAAGAALLATGTWVRVLEAVGAVLLLVLGLRAFLGGDSPASVVRKAL